MKRLIIIICALVAACPYVFAQKRAAVSTNLADYVGLGTMNLSADYGFARRWSATAEAKYNPFSISGGDPSEAVRNRQQVYSVGVRYWPWHIFSGWWLAGRVQYQEYNRSGFKERQSREGDRSGAGISGGYSYMLSPHFNMNVGLGLWTGYDKYVVYECARCGKTLSSGGKIFVLPNDLVLSFSYVF